MNFVVLACCVIVFFPAFEPGDVVRLKSETKEITVREVEKDVAHCIWLDADEQLRSAWFRSSMVVAVSP